jgi:hypothetical protein
MFNMAAQKGSKLAFRRLNQNLRLADDHDESSAAALNEHQAMVSRRANAYELGVFYRTLIDGSGKWRTQRDLAEAMNVSRAHVSKAITAAGLPRKLVSIFGPKLITFRLAACLNRLIDQFGLDHLLRNAERAPMDALTTDEILTLLVTGESAESTVQPRLRVIDTGKALRLELPELETVLPHLRQLESMIAWSVSMILSDPGRGPRRPRRYKIRARVRPAATQTEST